MLSVALIPKYALQAGRSGGRADLWEDLMNLVLDTPNLFYLMIFRELIIFSENKCMNFISNARWLNDPNLSMRMDDHHLSRTRCTKK